MTLVDWFTGMAANWDFFVPRSSVESILIATEEHDLKMFGDAAGQWQKQMGAREYRVASLRARSIRHAGRSLCRGVWAPCGGMTESF